MIDWMSGLTLSQTAPGSGEKADPAELRVPKSALSKGGGSTSRSGHLLVATACDCAGLVCF